MLWGNAPSHSFKAVCNFKKRATKRSEVEIQSVDFSLLFVWRCLSSLTIQVTLSSSPFGMLHCQLCETGYAYYVKTVLSCRKIIRGRYLIVLFK